MKRKIVILSVILIFSTLFIGCSKTHKEEFNEFENNICYLVNHKPYRYNELFDIMEALDLIVVP